MVFVGVLVGGGLSPWPIGAQSPPPPPPPAPPPIVAAPGASPRPHGQLLHIVDISKNFVPGVRAIPGPATIEYVAINPLVYPYWTMKVDNVVKDGPQFTLTGNAQTPLKAIDDGLTTPLPGPVPSPLPPYIPAYAPQHDTPTELYPACVTKTLVSTKGSQQTKLFNDCYASIQRSYSALDGNLKLNETSLKRTIVQYNSLVTRVSRLLASTSARCDTVANPDDPDATDLCAGAAPTMDEQMRHLDANLERWVIGGPSGLGGGLPITARAVVEQAAVIQPWPSDVVQSLNTAVTNLKDALDELPSPSPKPTGTAGTKAAAANAAATAAAKKATTLAAAAKAAATKAAAAKAAATKARGSKAAAAKTAAVKAAAAAKAAATKAASAKTAATKAAGAAKAAAQAAPQAACFDGDPASAATVGCVRDMRRMGSQLGSWTKGGNEEKSYTASLGQLQQYISVRLANLSLNRFYFRDHEGCRGLNGSRRDRTYTLQLDGTQVTSLTVVCESRIFLSGGVGFSSLSQGTYSAIPDTHVSPAPALPTGAGIIQQVSTSDIRPIPITLVNYRLADVGQTGEQGIYTSFGVGLASSQQNSFLDYVGGLSYGTSKGALATLGAHLGQQNVLQPGYKVGDAVTGQAPVTTRNRVGWIVVFSYGKQ